MTCRHCGCAPTRHIENDCMDCPSCPGYVRAEPTTADEDWEEFDRMANPTEPTTAEAFQELRDDIDSLGTVAELPKTTSAALRNLALLERRMQEMERRLGDV